MRLHALIDILVILLVMLAIVDPVRSINVILFGCTVGLFGWCVTARHHRKAATPKVE